MSRRRLPSSLHAGEPERLLAAARCPRDRLLVLLGLLAGPRVAEAVSLRVEDVDLERAVLTIRRGKGDRDRAVPINARLAVALAAWLDGRRTGWLFPAPRRAGAHLSVRAVQLLVRAAAARAGITRTITPHKLRHTFALALLRSGADIMEIRDLLGHSSVATTQVNLSADGDRLRAAVERL